MKLLAIFTCLAFVALATGAPTKNDDNEILIITKDFYPLSLVKYKSQHDIVNIIVPLNSINFDDDDSSSSEEDDSDITLFFVEADVDENGKRTDQGLYVFKDNKATKLLDHGRDAAASINETGKVFFGAQDGLYVYKPETNEAIKYGSITDSIIGMAVTISGDTIYILTEDHELYKVTDEGNTKTKVEEVVNAQQIIADYSNNIYFYAQDKQPYVLTANGVKKVEGLPANPQTVTLIKPPFIIEDGVPFIVDNAAYIIYENGTSELTDFEFKPKAKPSAYAMEGTLIQYYGYEKKIYEYNLVAMLLTEMLKEFKNFLQENNTTIQSLAKQKKRTKLA